MSSDEYFSASPEVMEALMNDPVKRAFILQLLTKESKQLQKKAPKEQSPVLVRQRKYESPIALQRRRAMEAASSTDTNSDVTEVLPEDKGPELPLGELLKGVRAYVEVIKGGVDKSGGIKAVMQLMGAEILENLTRKVTHVVFKDGSFSTFEKARLLKTHLVSVLWLEAVKRNKCRVPEKNYPAIGAKVGDVNVSIILSQIEKDYDEVIRDERRCRRQSQGRTRVPQSPELTSDDSDAGLVNGEVSKRNNTNVDVTTNKWKRGSMRKTSHVVADMDITPNNEICSILTENRNSLEKVQNDVPNPSTLLTKTAVDRISDTDKTRSGLEQTVDTDRTKSNLEKSTGSDKTTSSLETTAESKRNKRKKKMSDKSGNKENCTVTTLGTTMSSLRLSSSTKNSKTDHLEAITESNRQSNGPTVKSTEANGDLMLTESKKRKTPQQTKDKIAIEQSHKCIRRNLFDSFDSESDEIDIFDKTNDSVSCKRKAASVLPTKASDKTPRTRRAVSAIPRSTGKCLLKDMSDDASENVETREQSKSVRRSSQGDKIKKPSVILERLDLEGIKKKSPFSAKTRILNKKRKLYNPQDSALSLSAGDEQNEKERQEYHKQKTAENNNVAQPTDLDLLKIVEPRQQLDVSSITESDISDDMIDIEAITKATNIKNKPGNKSNANDSTGSDGKVSKKKKNVPATVQQHNDEQKDLLYWLTKHEEGQTRRSDRLRLSQSKPKYTLTSSESSNSTISVPVKQIQRRSTMDFVPLTQTPRKRNLMLHAKHRKTIVCTMFHRDEVHNFERIVKKLGTFETENRVTARTTHLIAGETKRTINMLKAIARGCWVLTHDWLLKSEKAGKWLDEEGFEVTDFSPAVQQCRRERDAFGPQYSMDIFANCGKIYLAEKTNPSRADLKELVSICKGKITTISRNADIIVGEVLKRDNITCVKETWILDSITSNKVKPLQEYLLVGIESRHSPNF